MDNGGRVLPSQPSVQPDVIFLSANQLLLTTLVFRLAVVAALATMLVRFQRFRRILLTERRDWPERLTFVVGVGVPLTIGTLSRLLLGYRAVEFSLAGPFLAGLIAGVRTDALDHAVFDNERGGRSALTDLGASFAGGIDQDLVEHGPARRDGQRVAGVGREGHALEGPPGAMELRAASGEDTVEQSPFAQELDPVGGHEVGGERVAGKVRPVDQQHAVSTPGQQHGRG